MSGFVIFKYSSTMYKIIILSILLVLIAGCQQKESSNDVPDVVSQQTKGFFSNLKTFCGDEFFGKIEYPNQSGHQLTGSETKLVFDDCLEDSISIKFYLNQIHTMDWTITKAKEVGLNLLFYHPDNSGLPDGVDSYNGVSNPDGTDIVQYFIPTQQTIQDFPEIARNKWILKLDTINNTLTYMLFRADDLRFKAIYQK